VVLLELLKARRLLPAFDAAVDVFVLVENEQLRSQSLGMIQDLRTGGLVVEYSLTPAKPDRQFKRAQELKASYTAKIESESTVRIRNLKTRQEVVCPAAEAVKHLGR
jgi:histidyl-tRNA synthetase